MAKHDAGDERLGAKVLSLPDVIAQSVGFMGPVFSSAFVIPLVVGVISASGKGGGVASPLSVLIAAVGVFAIGWIVSSYAKEVHAAGSLYDYVTRGLGGWVGTAAGWLYYAGVTVLMTGLLLLIGGYLQSTIASEFSVNPLPAWAWTLIVIALITVVLYFGVRVSVRSQLVLALVSIIVVTVFFIVVIVKLGSANSLKPFNPSSSADGWSGVFFGVPAFGGVRAPGQPGRGDPQAASARAHRGHDHGRDRHRVLRAGRLRGGGGLPLQPEDADRGGVGAAVRAGRGQVGGRVRRHLDRPAARAGRAVRHGGRGHRLRHLGLARDLRHGPRPAHPGRAGGDLQAAQLAAGRHDLPDRRLGGNPAGGPVLEGAVRAAGHAAVLRAVRVGVDVRRFRAGGGVPDDGHRVAAELRPGAGAGVDHHLRRARPRDHRGGHLRVVLQGDQPDDPGTVVRPGCAAARVRVHVRDPVPAAGQFAAGRPDEGHVSSAPRCPMLGGWT